MRYLVLGMKFQRKDVWRFVYKEEMGEVKRCIYKSKKEANVQFGRKMNQDVDGNMKLL